MPTTQKLITITVDADLQRRLKRAAARSGKSVSRFVRELLEIRLRPVKPATERCPLLDTAGVANGELTDLAVDEELYGNTR